MTHSPRRRTTHYHSFILTLWQEGEPAGEAAANWRFRLENPHTGERIGFRSAVELGAYFARWAVQEPPAGEH